MQALQTGASLSNGASALAHLQAGLAADVLVPQPIEDVEAYERQGYAVFMAAERAVLARARLNLEAPVIEVEGVPYRRVWRCAQMYTSAAGPLRIERTRYAQRQDGAHARCPLELRAGMIEGQWSPRR